MPDLGGIMVDVVNADALETDCDMLVLKYAQKLHGLDRIVVDQLRLSHPSIDTELPPPSAVQRYTSLRLHGPRAFLIVGVPPLRSFLYDEIAAFTSKVFTELAAMTIELKVVGLTLHGAGYGLDELACFDGMITGISTAIESGEVPRGLQRIKIIEHRRGRSRRMDEYLADTSRVITATGSRPAAKVTSSSRTAFIAMPFEKAFDDVYNFGIQRALHDLSIKCERLDQESFIGDIVEEIRRRISRADLVVADLTGASPNVYLEVGFAWGRGVPTVLLAASPDGEGTPLRFDTQGQKCLIYENITDLNGKLMNELSTLQNAKVI